MFLGCLFLSLVPNLGHSQAQFVQISSGNLVNNNLGENFGSAWADMNEDGYLDVFTEGRYFINNGNGSFTLVNLDYGGFIPVLADYNNNDQLDGPNGRCEKPFDPHIKIRFIRFNKKRNTSVENQCHEYRS